MLQISKGCWKENYLAAGTRQPLDKSGLWLSISRKLVSNVFREDCAFELPECSF